MKQAAHLVNVGSLAPVKDQATLLRVFAQVIQELPAARMTIAGIGALEHELRDLARTLKINPNVTFAGNIEHDRLPTLYHSADLYVQTSRHEGEGMALLEAAACGCAVCGTDVGALHDLMRREAAFTAPVGDIDTLTKVILRTLEATPHLAARASEIVHREYNLEQISGRLLDEYTQLTAPYKPSRAVRPLADA